MNSFEKELREKYKQDITTFHNELNAFANELGSKITMNGEWTIKGFIDLFQNIYTLSTDTKVLSKILELHIFPLFQNFATAHDFNLELATHQNYYPDLSFISRRDPMLKFAIDLKTTYEDEKKAGFCNGFTLGSHGEYFENRKSTKNIQYPYQSYAAHFCLGIIYVRNLNVTTYETRRYSLDELPIMPSIVRKFTFFATEKWRIASDKGGSGNTANIGSIKKIDDILNGNGVFAKAGEDIFDDYWTNFGRIQVPNKNGDFKKMTSFDEYISYRSLPLTIVNTFENDEVPSDEQ